MLDGEAQQWGRRALDFVDAAERLDEAEIIRTFEAQLAACGFSAYIMADLPSPGVALPDRLLANGWPREWYELYTREHYGAVDPVLRRACSTEDPFEWSEARYDPERDPAAHMVMTRAAEFGLADGYCIPLNRDRGGAVISMAGEQPDLSTAAKHAMQLISVYTHNRLRVLTRSKPRRRDLLTARECEVLRWAAHGKTAWEISVILRIAERTVKFHLIEASKKLGAVNRTAAVAKALALKLIEL
jgi:LuxR family transcriptional regulator, quorum-sensing system regulator BjaR1